MRDRTEDKIILSIIRHGKTKANEERRYLGRTDLPLSEAGRSEIREKWPDAPEADIVFISPRLRARETAGILFSGSEESFCVIDNWREIDFGRFEMKNHTELDGDPEYQAWIDSGGNLPFPEGESREGFISRCMQGFDLFMNICRQKMEKEGKGSLKAAAVVHGGTVMAVVSSLSGRDYFDFQPSAGEGYQLELTMEGKLAGDIIKIPKGKGMA